MKSCPSNEQLADLVADALSPEDRDAHARHVEECGACQEKLAHLARSEDPENWRRAEQSPRRTRAEERLIRRLKRRGPRLSHTLALRAPDPAGRPTRPG